MVALADDDKVQVPCKDNTASTISFLKFRYGLQNFFAAMKILKEKELSSRQDFQILMEKHKNLEVEHSEAYAAIRSELCTAKETRRKLESVVSDLRCETSLKDTEIKHLRQEIKALMDTKNELIKDLKSSNYNLERKLQEKTHDFTVLMEKHERHSSLLEAIENEAYLVKQVVDETNACIKEKEEEVVEFKRSISKVLGFEDALLGKISKLEQEIADSLTHLSEKHVRIMELEEKISTKSAQQSIEMDLAICKSNLELKENFISKLKEEKEVLLEDMKKLELMTGKFHMAIGNQDKAILEYQQKVLDLEKNVTMLTETLTKTERKLSLAADDNDKLLKRLEEQKSGFVTQTQAWEAELQAYKDKIYGLEARIAKCEVSHLGSYPSADMKSSAKLQLAKDGKGELIMSETIQNSNSKFTVETLTIVYNAEKMDSIGTPYFSDIECLEDSILPVQMQSKGRRLGICASKINDGSSVKILDAQKNYRMHNIGSILERLGRPINILKMKRKPTPMAFVIQKFTRPSLAKIPRLKLRDQSNVVIGINFGISEIDAHQCQNFGVVREIDEEDGEERLFDKKQDDEVEKHENAYSTEPDTCTLITASAMNGHS